MSSARTPDPMTAASASRLAEFARACKAAIRVVAMYPPTHPAIQAALQRMVAAGAAATDGGALTITVLPDTLLVGGRGMPKSDTAVDELAALFHAHQIGEVTLTGPLTSAGWHTLLTLLSTAPEAVRADGGITKAWQAAGGGPVVIKEIDYAEVLRERTVAASAEDAGWQDLIDSCLVGDDRSALDERALASLLEIARDPERLGEFMARLQERARAAGHSLEIQRQSVLRLLHALANYAAAASPDEFEEVMNNIASGTARLTPELMLSLLNDPGPPREAGDEGVNLAGELRARYGEDRLAAFVAENVSRDRGATGRLVEAFNALAISDEQRRTALALAEERLSLSPLGADPEFNELWTSAVSLLLSYSDADYVPDDYDRELTAARTRAVEIEQITDDPPDRIAAWISTVNDDDLRALDQQMLVDLLRLEDRREAWMAVLDLALTRLEQLVLVGDLRLATEMAGAVSAVAADPASPFAGEARAGLARATGGPLVGHLMLVMRQAADSEMPLLFAFCETVGSGLVAPLARALGVEESRLAVRRVKDILIAFGAAARGPARALRDSSNPAVRRAAIEVLQAVGGDEALPDLRAMLTDADPHVQREALRAIIRIGSDKAFATLEAALTAGEPGVREAIRHTIGALADERATPLLVYVLTHTSHRGAAEATYIAAIEALGRSGADPRGIAALRQLLYRGEWWAPARTARIRAAAARALHATASAAGDAVLEEARHRGPRGVRAAASQAMTMPRHPRPAGGAS